MMVDALKDVSLLLFCPDAGDDEGFVDMSGPVRRGTDQIRVELKVRSNGYYIVIQLCHHAVSCANSSCRLAVRLESVKSLLIYRSGTAGKRGKAVASVLLE